MTELSAKREGIVDGMPRDERGYWKPDKEIGVPNPVFAWPPKPKAVLKWLKDYLWPMNIIYIIVATLTWIFLTPQMSRMTEFRVGWILEIFVRNQLMLIILASVLHVRLWTQKSQGLQYKWSPNWMGKSRKFLWNDQVRDNVFWSVVSAGTIWTGFEVVMLWAYANGIIPFVDPREQTGLLRPDPLSRRPVARFPLLLGSSPVARKATLQNRALCAPQEHRHRTLVRFVDAPGRAPALLHLHAHPLGRCLASHPHDHERATRDLCRNIGSWRL